MKVGHHRAEAEPWRRRHGPIVRAKQLMAIALLILGAGPSLGADLPRVELHGTWRRDGEWVVAWLTFQPGGQVLSETLFIGGLGPGMNEGFGGGGDYRQAGSRLTLDGSASEAWPFETPRLVCTVTVSVEAMTLSQCQGFDRNTGAPVAIPDSIWQRVDQPPWSRSG